MKENKAKVLIDNAMQKLITQIEDGHSESLVNYLKAISHFHSYSFTNIILIQLQFPEAIRIAGFHTWKRLGRYVKSGEKAIRIVAPIVKKKSDVVEKPNSEEKDICGFRIVNVFDINQTSGEELPQFEKVKGNPQVYSNRLNNYIAECNIELEYSDELKYDGISVGGKIVIRSNLTLAEDFSVRIHELAHELLHKSKDTIPSKKLKETEAEAVAFIVSYAIGLDVNTSFSDYIQMYKGEKDTILRSLERIQKTSSIILDKLSINSKV